MVDGVPEHVRVVVEIGPGKGVLTMALLERFDRVVAIEKDHRMVAFLRETFAKAIETGTLIVIEADVLAQPVSHYLDAVTPYVVIANIPYYITGAITEHVLADVRLPLAIRFLIQKEVAERMVARDGAMSILALSVQAYGRVTLVQKVPRGAFVPPPKVDSAIVEIGPLSKHYFQGFDEKLFFDVIKAGFAHKRKYLARNLEAVYEASNITAVFLTLGLSPQVRAETLSTVMWQKLVGELAKYAILKPYDSR